jgi:hypothetical protein
MTSPDEKRRRKDVLREVKRRNRERAEAAMPISKPLLRELLLYVERAVNTHGCGHSESLLHTHTFLTEHNLAAAGVVPWLNEYGGYCDCEVAANVLSEWSYIFQEP